MDREKAKIKLNYLEMRMDDISEEISRYLNQQKSYSSLISEVKLNLAKVLVLEKVSYNTLMFDFEYWIRYENSLEHFTKLYKCKLDELNKIQGRIGNLRYQLKDENNNNFYDCEDDEND